MLESLLGAGDDSAVQADTTSSNWERIVSTQSQTCPHCGKALTSEMLAMEGREVCPHCLLPLDEGPGLLQASIADTAPDDPGKEIPELSPSAVRMQWVRSISLCFCLAAVLICLWRLFPSGKNSAHPAELTAIAIIAIISAFVWFYTQFAITLKSRSR